MGKTAKEWISELPAPYNSDKENASEVECNNLGNAISGGFLWDYSENGWEVWDKIQWMVNNHNHVGWCNNEL